MTDTRRLETIASLCRIIADLDKTLTYVRRTLSDLQRDADAPAPVTYIDPRFADCLSRGVPQYHDTVLGYLANHRPDVLELMDFDKPEATCRDGFWLAHRHKRVTYVPAPDVLRAKGIMRVRCWPVVLLEQRFG